MEFKSRVRDRRILLATLGYLAILLSAWVRCFPTAEAISPPNGTQRALQPIPALTEAGRIVIRVPSCKAGVTVRLLQDGRLLETHLKAMWEVGDVDFLVGSGLIHPDDPAWQPLLSAPLLNAVLELSPCDGVASSLLLERPLARIEELPMGFSQQSTVLVTVDHSAGMGAYSGTVTRIVSVSKEGVLQWLDATFRKGNERRPIVLTKSLRSDWRLTPLDRDGERDILQVSCQTYGAEKAHRTERIRYSLNKGQWVRRVRSEVGCWEIDQAFPAEREFP